MKETTFKLTKSTGKEYPARFAGQEVKLPIPDSMDEVRGLIQTGVDADKALVGAVNGQGYLLTIQKKVKDYLGSDKVTPETSIESALAAAREYALGTRIGEPRAKGIGGGGVAKVKAELDASNAKVDAAKESLRSAYTKMPKNLRTGLRTDLLERGVFSEAELAEMDNGGK